MLKYSLVHSWIKILQRYLTSHFDYFDGSSNRIAQFNSLISKERSPHLFETFNPVSIRNKR